MRSVQFTTARHKRHNFLDEMMMVRRLCVYQCIVGDLYLGTWPPAWSTNRNTGQGGSHGCGSLEDTSTYCSDVYEFDFLLALFQDQRVFSHVGHKVSGKVGITSNDNTLGHKQSSFTQSLPVSNALSWQKFYYCITLGIWVGLYTDLEVLGLSSYFDMYPLSCASSSR